MNKASKKHSNLIRTRGALLLVVAAFLTLPGCVSVANVLKANNDVIAGKVYRLKVQDKWGLNDKDGYEKSDTGRTAYTKFQTLFKIYGGAPTSEQALPYRFTSVGPNGAWEGVTIFNNGPAGNLIAFVADGVPLLKEGDLVDVYVYDTAVMSVKNRRYAVVIRLVCMQEDMACTKQEKNSNRTPGRIVQSKGQFDERLVTISPHMNMNGNWLPGKEPKRPPLREGVAVEEPKALAE